MQQCFSRDLDQQRLSQRRRNPRPRRGGTPNTASQRRNTKQHCKGKGWLKTSRDIDSKYHETLKTSLRIREVMESSQPENKTLLRVARCDNKATKCMWLGRVSKTARVTVKITKHEIPLKTSRTRAKTNRERLTHCD